MAVTIDQLLESVDRMERELGTLRAKIHEVQGHQPVASDELARRRAAVGALRDFRERLVQKQRQQGRPIRLTECALEARKELEERA